MRERLRIIDATLSECIRSARGPVDRSTLRCLDGLLPMQQCLAAAPILPDDAYGAEILSPLIRHAAVLEPFTWETHRELAAEPAPQRRFLVDPEGVGLGARPRHLALADGWHREAVVWCDQEVEDADLLEAVRRALDPLPETARLRIRDPAGWLDPERALALARAPEAHRLVLAHENASGLALATARAVLRIANGPSVRTTLLGIGPRTGFAATELLVDDPHDLQGAAERTALATGIAIPGNHPLWGAFRNEAVEPETVDRPGAHPRWNLATAPLLLERHLESLGIDSDEEMREGLLRRLMGRLRPGDPLDEPTVYAFLATHLDLPRLAHASGAGAPDEEAL